MDYETFFDEAIKLLEKTSNKQCSSVFDATESIEALKQSRN